MSHILKTRREEGSESAMAQFSNVVTSQGAQLQWLRTGAQEHPGLATHTVHLPFETQFIGQEHPGSLL